MTCQGGKVSGGYYLYPSQKELIQSSQAMAEIFGITKWNTFNQQSKDFFTQMYASAKYGPSAGRQQAYETLQKGIEMAQDAVCSIKNTYKTAVDNNTQKNTLNGILKFCNAAESAKKQFSPYGSPTQIQTEFYDEMKNFMRTSRFCGATNVEELPAVQSYNELQAQMNELGTVSGGRRVRRRSRRRSMRRRSSRRSRR